MKRTGAPPIGWSVFLVCGVAAAALPLSWQLAFAALAVIGLGLPHGASDMALVPPERRVSFLVAYGAMIAGVVAVWLVVPAAALIAFLLVSVVHFATDDRSESPALRWATAAIIVAGPALLYRPQIEALIGALAADPWLVTALAAAMAEVAMVALAVITARLLVWSDEAWSWRLLIGIAAAVALPPLVGFAIAFVLLHAHGQTRELMSALRCETMVEYARLIAPVMAGALLVVAGVALVFAQAPSPAIGTLFAALSALAAPHMTVTPWWRRERAERPALVGARLG